MTLNRLSSFITDWRSLACAAAAFVAAAALTVAGIGWGALVLISDSPTHPGMRFAAQLLHDAVWMRSISFAYGIAWIVVTFILWVFARRHPLPHALRSTAIAAGFVLVLAHTWTFGSLRADLADAYGGIFNRHGLTLTAQMRRCTPGNRVPACAAIAEDQARSRAELAVPVPPPSREEAARAISAFFVEVPVESAVLLASDTRAFAAYQRAGAIIPGAVVMNDGRSATVPSVTPWGRAYRKPYRCAASPHCPVEFELGTRTLVDILAISPTTPQNRKIPFTVAFSWRYAPNPLGERLLQSGFVPRQQRLGFLVGPYAGYLLAATREPQTSRTQLRAPIILGAKGWTLLSIPSGESRVAAP